MKQVSNHVAWLIAVAVMTLCMGALYVTIRQALRYGANEPQRSMATDAAYVIEHGGKPVEWGDSRVDMDLSTAPFIIIYDHSGNIVSGNGYLDGTVPKVPIGVLDHAAKNGDNAVTWAPRKDVRIASVTVPAGEYFVLSGRSLAVVDSQIVSLGQWLATVWAVALIAAAVAFLLSTLRKNIA